MKELKGQVLNSMQLHPLLALANNGLISAAHNNNGSAGGLSLLQSSNLTITPTASSSSSGPAGSSSSSPPTSSSSSSLTISGPNGALLPSGLSVTITPASSNHSHSNRSSPSTHTHTHNNHHHKSSASSNAHKFEPPSSPMSPAMSVNSNSALSPQATAAAAVSNLQQQQLRAFATGLQASLQAAAAANQANASASANSAAAGLINQASFVAAASKMMEMNQADDLVMQEITARLFKMNQEIWQQAAAVANSEGNSNHSSPGSGGGGHSSRDHHGHGHRSPSSSAAAAAAVAAAHHQQTQQHHVNEIKLAEKLVNELALQIFMHKSAMQLQQQQQQQQASAQQQVQNHHMGNGGAGLLGNGLGGGGNGLSHGHPGQSLIRAGSVCSNVSENGGVGKPHQCQQCMKAFSSNHQLVQHVRVHTGEKPYKCSYCERRFKQLSHVQQHTRLHTGERPYKCHVHECGRAFIQLSNLQQHLRNHDAQLERSKNRPFHCNICGKGFATESSLRTHTAKQHASLIGGPSTVSCPVCHKLFLGGEALMEHMKHTHKDPNASGVATKRRTANHPCPVCGKHYVNEGSLRKHMTCHPETAQLTSSLRMWPCSVCQAVFTHESGLLTHMEQMRTDPKHQFAAQYVLSRAAAERRERESILTAAAVAAIAGGHSFTGGPQGHPLSAGSMNPLLPMAASPSGSESSGRLSSPMDNSGHSHHHRSRLAHSSPSNGPLDARVNNGNSVSSNNSSNTANNNNIGDPSNGGRKDFNNAHDKYEMYEKMAHENNNIPLGMRDGHHNQQSMHHPNHMTENGMNKFQATEAAMKMAAMLGQNHSGGSHGHGQNDIRNLIHHQQHGQDMMSAIRNHESEALLRSQAAEAIRMAVANNMDRSSNNSGNNSNAAPNGNNATSAGEALANHLNLTMTQAQQQHHMQQQQQDISRLTNGHSGSNHHHHNMQHHSNALNHQLNSILSQQPDLSEALLRLDARSLGFPLPAHNS